MRWLQFASIVIGWFYLVPGALAQWSDGRTIYGGGYYAPGGNPAVYGNPGVYTGYPQYMQGGVVSPPGTIIAPGRPMYQYNSLAPATGYPATPYRFFGGPVALPGGYYGISSGATQYRFWRGASGYYYPWYPGQYASAPPVIIYQQGSPAAALPPISTIFKDMQELVDDSKSKGTLKPGDYEHLNRRLHDLMRKEQDMRANADGTLDSGQEADLRKDINDLGSEISYRIRG